jgi:hypothetical protein
MDIALNARFYPLQMTQNALFLMPLVGIESFVHGLGKVLPGQWKEAVAEARAVGAIRADLPSFFLEDTPEKIVAMAEKLGKGVQFTEEINRVWAYHGGKHNALLHGLTEQQAILKGKDVVRDTNFYFTAAHRPTATTTPTGSMLMRYRTFSNEYATFLLHHIRQKNWDVVSSSLGVLLSISGTYGVPFYGLAQYALAQQGVVLPTIDPVDELFGISTAGAGSALPNLPMSSMSLAGPVLAPAVALMQGGSGKEAVALAIQKLAGRPLTQVAQGIAEISRQGMTRTPGGEMKVRRGPGRVGQSMLNLAPSAQNEMKGIRDELQLAVQARDMRRVKAIREHAGVRGISPNLGDLLGQVRSAQSREENRSLIDLIMGAQ